MMRQWGNFWKADLKNADAILRQALVSHVITAKHARPAHDPRAARPHRRGHRERRARRGRQPAGPDREARAEGARVEHGHRAQERTASPPSRSPLGFFGRNRCSSTSASPKRTGATAARRTRTSWNRKRRSSSDAPSRRSPPIRNVLARSGHLWSSWELARHYGFTDVDGRRPDWGALKPDFSGHPAVADRAAEHRASICSSSG